MSYLQCRRCGLQIRNRGTILRVENCPRCLARSATVSPLEETASWVSPTPRWGATAFERAEDPRAPHHT
jgi:hypothetical protein